MGDTYIFSRLLHSPRCHSWRWTLGNFEGTEGLEIRQKDARDTDPSKVSLEKPLGIFEGYRGTRKGHQAIQCVPRGEGQFILLRNIEGHLYRHFEGHQRTREGHRDVQCVPRGEGHFGLLRDTEGHFEILRDTEGHEICSRDT